MTIIGHDGGAQLRDRLPRTPETNEERGSSLSLEMYFYFLFRFPAEISGWGLIKTVRRSSPLVVFWILGKNNVLQVRLSSSAGDRTL